MQLSLYIPYMHIDRQSFNHYGMVRAYSIGHAISFHCNAHANVISCEHAMRCMHTSCVMPRDIICSMLLYIGNMVIWWQDTS